MEGAHPAILNVTLTTQSVEYPVTFGGNTNIKKILVKPRDITQTILLAYVSGGTSSGPYITLPPSMSYSEEDLHAGFTLYAQCTTAAGVVLEVLYWI